MATKINREKRSGHFMPQAVFKILLHGVIIVGCFLYIDTAHAASFIGSSRCGECHPFAYQRWLKGPHANARLSLSAQEATDPKCAACHVTLPVKGEVLFKGDMQQGIQCEHCHGGGRYYYPEYVMRDSELSRAVGLLPVTESTCLRCHTADTPSLLPFNFKKSWEMIDHGAAAREQWEIEQEEQKDSQSSPQKQSRGQHG